MAARKRGGLGKGLDALIPFAESEPGAGANGKGEEAGRNPENDRKQELSKGENPEKPTENLIKTVKLTSVEPDKRQPRRKFDQEKLQELAESIKEKGLLEPILVQEKAGHYEIIAGERRWRACRIAGLKEIPVIVRNYDEQERIEISLIENIQREDLNPIEEAKAYCRLMEEFHLRQEDVAQKVCRNRASVANTMRLLKLDENVQEMVADGGLSMGQARALISIDNKEMQRELAAKISENNLSVREVEKLIRQLTVGKKGKKREKTEISSELEIAYKDIAGRMTSSLGMKTSIRQQEGGGKLEIEFSGQDDLEKLMDRLLV